MAPLKRVRFLKTCVLSILLGVMPFAVTTSPAQGAQTATDRLFRAVRNNDLGMAQSSVAAGGDVNATNALGITPVDMAVDKGFFDIAHFLLSIRNQEQFSKTTTPPVSLPPVKVESSAAPLSPLPAPPPPVARVESAWPKGKPNPFDPDARPASYSPPIIEDDAKPPLAPAARLGDNLPEGVAFGPAVAAGIQPASVTNQEIEAEQTAEPAAPSAIEETAPVEEEKTAGFLQDISDFFTPDALSPEETPKVDPVVADGGDVDGDVDVDVAGPAEAPALLEKAAPAIPVDPGEATPNAYPPIIGQVRNPGDFSVAEEEKSTDSSPISGQDDLPADVEAAIASTPQEKQASEAVREFDAEEDGDSSPVSRFFGRVSDILTPDAEPEETTSVAENSSEALETPSPDKMDVTEEIAEAPTVEQPISDLENAEPESDGNFFDGITRLFSSDEETPETMAPEEDATEETEQQDVNPEPDSLALAAPPRSTALPLPIPVKEETLEEPVEPNEAVEEDPVKGLLDKLAGFLKSDETDNAGENEETAEAGPEDQWAVKKVKTSEKVKTPPPPPIKKDLEKPKAQYLRGTVLAMGQTLKLGRLRKGRAEPGKSCIEKNRDQVAFCIDSVDWPDSIRKYFEINSVLYNGAKAIARYDGNAATNFHALFPSTAFAEIVSYYTQRYGDPTFNLNRSIAPLAQPRRKNPTVIWRSADPLTKQFTSLEIRKYDDSRGGFPDTRRGAVMLYRQWSLPIFPHLSTIELMILNSNS